MTHTLFELIEQDNIQAIETAIAQGADINAQNKTSNKPYDKYETPLTAAMNSLYRPEIFKHQEANSKRVNTTLFLLQYADVNVDIPDCDGCAPLHIAIDLNNVTLIQKIIERGADVNARDQYGNTPLFHTLKAYDYMPHDIASIATSLLKKGAEVNTRDERNKTELLFVLSANSACNDIPLIKVLLDHGADINAQDQYGNTPLFSAVNYVPIKKEAMLECLLQYHPLNIKNHSGQTASQYMDGLSDRLKGKILALADGPSNAAHGKLSNLEARPKWR